MIDQLRDGREGGDFGDTLHFLLAFYLVQVFNDLKQDSFRELINKKAKFLKMT